MSERKREAFWLITYTLIDGRIWKAYGVCDEATGAVELENYYLPRTIGVDVFATFAEAVEAVNAAKVEHIGKLAQEISRIGALKPVEAQEDFSVGVLPPVGDEGPQNEI